MSPCISQVNQQTRFLRKWFLQLSQSVFHFQQGLFTYLILASKQVSSTTRKFRFNNQVCWHIWFLHLNKFPALHGSFGSITRFVHIFDSCIYRFPALHGSFGAITRFVVNLHIIILVSESRMWKNLVSDQLRLDAPYTFEIFSLSISWTKRQASEGRKTFKLNLPKTMKSHKPGYCTKGFNC